MSESEFGNHDTTPLAEGIPVNFESIAASSSHNVTIVGPKSNHQILIEATSDRVTIQDMQSPSYGIECRHYTNIDEPDSEEIPSYVSLDVTTTIEQNGERIRHPDFRAKKLCQAMIAYFERVHGPIYALQFALYSERNVPDLGTVPASDNFKKYMETKAEILNQLLKEGLPGEEAKIRAQKRAAESIWGYQELAVGLGFTEPEDIEEITYPTGEQEVTGKFTKPKQ